MSRKGYLEFDKEGLSSMGSVDHLVSRKGHLEVDLWPEVRGRGGGACVVFRLYRGANTQNAIFYHSD